jgi:hypothetical protein
MPLGQAEARGCGLAEVAPRGVTFRRVKAAWPFPSPEEWESERMHVAANMVT